MELNKDDRVVSIDKDQFLNLLALARVGAKETKRQSILNSVIRHTARFNQNIPNYVAFDHQLPMRERRIEKQIRRDLLKCCIGKHIYVRENHTQRLTRFTFTGRDSGSRHKVRVFGWSYLHGKAVHLSFDPSEVRTVVPPEYEVEEDVGWRACYRLKDAPKTEWRGYAIP